MINQYNSPFQTLNSNSARSVKYLIRPNYYIQVKKKWYYVYTTIKKKPTNVNLCNNNFKYCFHKLYYDCKHLIV